MFFWYIYTHDSTNLPHKAVAEVSKEKEPIGKGCVEFNWFKSQLMSDSNELRLKSLWLSIDLGFKWLGCEMIWDSIDLAVKCFGCQMIWDSNDLVVKWSGIQVICMSNDWRFKWFGCQVIWMSNDLRFKYLVVKWFEIQMIWLSMVWDVKNEALKFKSEAFLRDFLQNWNFEAQKRSFCARLPPKRSFSARLPSKIEVWSSKTDLFCETSFKNDMSTRHFLTWPQNSNTF